MIVHPITKIEYTIHSDEGVKILRKYVQIYKNGGMMSNIKNSIFNVYERVKSFVSPEELSTANSIMRNDIESIDDNKTEDNTTVEEPTILKPPSRKAYKLIPIRNSIKDNLDLNIQISNEIIEEINFWEPVLKRELIKWETYTNRSRSPVYGRLSPSLLHDYEQEKHRAQNRIKTMRSPGGYRLQTTVEGDLDTYFMDRLPEFM